MFLLIAVKFTVGILGGGSMYGATLGTKRSPTLLKMGRKSGSMLAVLAAINFLFLLFLLLFIADFLFLYTFLGAMMEMEERILERKSFSGVEEYLLVDME